MAGFVPRSVTLKGQIRLSASVDLVFQMFSRLGEKLWVPGWNPELLYPAGTTWEEGVIFRTQEETGDAVWIVTKLDTSTHHVIYHRVESTRYVARVEVHCSAIADNLTGAATEYLFVGLSESGNREITAMTQHSYDAKMTRWANWINHYFQTTPLSSRSSEPVASCGPNPDGIQYYRATSSDRELAGWPRTDPSALRRASPASPLPCPSAKDALVF